MNTKEDKDTLMSKEEFDAIIEQGLRDIKAGNTERYSMDEYRRMLTINNGITRCPLIESLKKSIKMFLH